METLKMIGKILAVILLCIAGGYVKDFISKIVYGYDPDRYKRKKKRY